MTTQSALGSQPPHELNASPEGSEVRSRPATRALLLGLGLGLQCVAVVSCVPAIMFGPLAASNSFLVALLTFYGIGLVICAAGGLMQAPPLETSYHPVTRPEKAAATQSVERHPQARLALILSLIGLLSFAPVAPFAWWLGSSVLGDIRRQPGRYTGGREARIGQLLGAIGTVLLVILIVFIVWVVVLVSSASP